jgi:RNA polymerase sigma factor (TIGR02999 family)
MGEESGAITRLLGAARNGDVAAESRLLDLMYADLKRLARRLMRAERGNHTLQPSALVNEAYVRLMGAAAVSWENRSHFLAYAATAMRRVLVDYARAHAAEKRGGKDELVSLDDGLADGREPADDSASRHAAKAAELIALDDALTRLKVLDRQQARIVELRYFAGMSESEIAAHLDISVRSVFRGWRAARLWLRREIDGNPAADEG